MRALNCLPRAINQRLVGKLALSLAGQFCARAGTKSEQSDLQIATKPQTRDALSQFQICIHLNDEKWRVIDRRAGDRQPRAVCFRLQTSRAIIRLLHVFRAWLVPRWRRLRDLFTSPVLAAAKSRAACSRAHVWLARLPVLRNSGAEPAADERVPREICALSANQLLAVGFDCAFAHLLPRLPLLSSVVSLLSSGFWRLCSGLGSRVSRLAAGGWRLASGV